jgi:hypothetical protein
MLRRARENVNQQHKKALSSEREKTQPQWPRACGDREQLKALGILLSLVPADLISTLLAPIDQRCLVRRHLLQVNPRIQLWPTTPR